MDTITRDRFPDDDGEYPCLDIYCTLGLFHRGPCNNHDAAVDAFLGALDLGPGIDADDRPAHPTGLRVPSAVRAASSTAGGHAARDAVMAATIIALVLIAFGVGWRRLGR